MVEKFTDLKFTEAKSKEEIDQILKDNLGIGLSECSQVLSDSLNQRAEELVEDFINIIPYNDYSKILEGKEDILKFLRKESIKNENWELQFVEVKKEQDQLMELVFFNKSVDDGDILKGFVFLGLSGKIRHAFVQVNT